MLFFNPSSIEAVRLFVGGAIGFVTARLFLDVITGFALDNDLSFVISVPLAIFLLWPGSPFHRVIDFLLPKEDDKEDDEEDN